ncbi:two-component system sensor histidine kinase MtrB [Thermocatellispora tengchongensis]|uniref:histidine kinase n=1 Tax=Thermocatellispora tengchongensis TaxID=1073253 RepID=A0A840NYL3_9ACTN|nr:HAMP domain-containing sensor histidine kinase [Thermocatellispora tengchongensis]MBB5130751.1 two-component system sensor histidine kinase MtrB [Thermocatellispora tengchongensis]
MTWRPWPRGLRARLVVAVVLVTVLGATAAAWASARSARSALVDSARQRLAQTVAGQIGAIAPELTYPPDQGTLDRLRAAVGPNTLVTYRNLRSADDTGTEPVTGALRSAVRARHLIATQVVTAGGRPFLLVGTPIVITAPDGARTSSGIEVYTGRDLTDVEGRVDDLTRSAAYTAALALPLAVLLALLAARSVLRPVRELRDTARRLAAGDLGARSPPQGADELADLAVTVNEMAESLQRMQADARRFAADVSHELRTPLSTLMAVVDVLATAAAGMDSDARESSQLAIAETHRLVALVEDLMEVSRFDAGTARLRLEDVDVAGAVRGCLRARGWLDRVELVAPDGVVLRLDPRRLDVIVANLVGNALSHGEPPVRVQVSVSRDQVRIEVADSGPGLPQDVLPHVFDRFYKADTARPRTPGSGLGLAIALENARLHGGDLTAGNIAGGGARFTLRLPRNQEDG